MGERGDIVYSFLNERSFVAILCWGVALLALRLLPTSPTAPSAAAPAVGGDLSV